MARQILGVELPTLPVPREVPAAPVAPPPPDRTKLWVACVGLLTVLAAGGGAVVARPSLRMAGQLDDIAADVKAIKVAQKKRIVYLEAASLAEEKRWGITAAMLCALNGQPYVVGLSCRTVKLASVPIGVFAGFTVQGTEWPARVRVP
jgi:hypothetical protein